MLKSINGRTKTVLYIFYLFRWDSGAYVYTDDPKPDGGYCHPSFNENIDWTLSEESDDSGDSGENSS